MLVDNSANETVRQLGDAERRARGIPRVDTHRYTRENGWFSKEEDKLGKDRTNH